MNTPKIIMMVGLPCGGKTVEAHKLAEQYNAMVFSSDSLREELFGDVNEQSRNQELFTELHKRIKDCLREGKSAIYDATNIYYKKRMSFLAELKKIPCEKICVLMATPYEECLKRNAERERKVPEEVIRRMYMNFQCPYWYEGWDDIQIIYSQRYNKFPIRVIDEYINFNQENIHHKLTLGEHLRDTLVNIQDEIGTEDDEHSVIMRISAVLHDCAKPFCKSFLNDRGKNTSNAHYYSHQYCSSYESLFYKYMVNPLEVSIRVMWHMQPYFWERDNNERLHNKYCKLWGEELYQDIMKLHEADKAAH